MNTKFIVIIGVLLIVVFGGLFFSNNGKTQNTNISQSEPESGQIAPHYEWYSKESLTKAQQKGRTVLYFWAAWCPTCKALNEELLQKSLELPDDVTIIKINYDTETELKRKYQIVIQHTLVQVDKNGNEVTRWIGGNVDVIKQELK